MYQAYRKRRHGVLWLFLLLICATAVGIGIGYAAVKMGTLPDRSFAAPDDSPLLAATPSPDTAPAEEVQNKAVSLNAASVEEQPHEMPPKEGYLVKTEDGRVCVFKVNADGTTLFSHTMSVDLGDLPPADQKKLENGIYLETKTELAELAEDYSS